MPPPAAARPALRLAVVGHVEHVTLGRLPALPGEGDIAHVETPRSFAGGGGGIAFAQLARSPAELHLFTALGNDEAAALVARAVAATGARIHAVHRDLPHTRDLVLVTPSGERTIVVVGEPLHPRRDDPLPWELLGRCDAAYFTAEDPEALRAARAAALLVVTARRRPALAASGVRADVVLGSRLDPRERGSLADYPVPPGALVLTEGARGGTIETATGTTRFAAPVVSAPGADAAAPAGRVAYGAGDSFAGALVFLLACGVPLAEACALAAHHGAAVLRGPDPWQAQRPLAWPGAAG